MPYIPWLTLLLALPLIGLGLLALTPRGNERGQYRTAMFMATVTFLASLAVWFQFEPPAAGAFALEEFAPWVPAIGASYHLGIDGISLWLVLLTTILIPLAISSSWREDHRPKDYRTFLMLILGLEAALIGVFVALDLLLFYIFWEAVLIPMYFLIGLWGGEKRINSAMKFFVYTMIGSLLMLVAIFALWHASEARTFDYVTLLSDPGVLGMTRTLQGLLFGAFALAFAIKVPLFPLHTWLPDAHTDAPTAGSILLAGVLLKMGTYGLIRFNWPLFPEAVPGWTPVLGTMAVIGIIYGAWVASAQTDMKRLVAYSSVSHMGFVVLGILAGNELGMTGATLQMVNHGITTGALFMLVGFLYDRRHTREIAAYGGIIQVMPVFSILFWITLFASIGLPGLNGFVGEFLILAGVAQWSREVLVLASSGVIWGAIYMLWMFQRVFLGKVDRNSDNARLRDLDGHELRTIMPLICLMVVFGLYSVIATKDMGSSVAGVVRMATLDEGGTARMRVGVPPQPPLTSQTRSEGETAAPIASEQPETREPEAAPAELSGETSDPPPAEAPADEPATDAPEVPVETAPPAETPVETPSGAVEGEGTP